MDISSFSSPTTISFKRPARSQGHGTGDKEDPATFPIATTPTTMTSQFCMPQSSHSYACNDLNRSGINDDPVEASYSTDSIYPLSSATHVMGVPSSIETPLPKDASGPFLEPLMLFVDQDSPHWDTAQLHTANPINSSSFMLGNTYEMGQYFDDFFTTGEPESYFDYSHPASEVSISSPGEDVEDPTDKPYARLIYEALMQAPGRRMMLREIYDWFIQNTNKAQGSSSNGWQNSIRHNLSMNQAFENDRSEQGSCGYSRKANSLWYLTDEAITNGVQSTTRFRKSGPAKRSINQHANQVQRQKSGAKGGKATRRAVMHKRRCEVPPRDHLESSSNTLRSRHTSERIENPPCITSYPVDRSLTPADDLLYDGVHGRTFYDQYNDFGSSKIGLHEDSMKGLHDDFTRTPTQELDLNLCGCLRYEEGTLQRG